MPTNVSMETSSFASESLTGPADLIASLPGVLGFYPHESVIVLGLMESDKPGCTTLGPVMRVDITHAQQLCANLHVMPVEGCVALLAVLITRIPESPLADAATSALFHLTDESGAGLIDACWHVSEIATGTPYTLLFGNAEDPIGGGAIPADWCDGTVASVMASPAMKNLLDNGVLPELNREDSYRYFQLRAPRDAAEAEERAALEKLATRRGRELAEKIRRGDAKARAGAAEACRTLITFPSCPLLSEWEDSSLEPGSGEEDDLLGLATLLSRSYLRDRLIVDALAAPYSASTAMIRVAQTFTGVIRANALCVWAILAVDKGLQSWAIAALTTAQEEVPGHSMSALLIDLVRVGQHDSLIRAVREGSIAAWDF